jgi:hypothetical protein
LKARNHYLKDNYSLLSIANKGLESRACPKMRLESPAIRAKFNESFPRQHCRNAAGWNWPRQLLPLAACSLVGGNDGRIHPRKPYPRAFFEIAVLMQGRVEINFSHPPPPVR